MMWTIETNKEGNTLKEAHAETWPQALRAAAEQANLSVSSIRAYVRGDRQWGHPGGGYVFPVKGRDPDQIAVHVWLDRQ